LGGKEVGEEEFIFYFVFVDFLGDGLGGPGEGWFFFFGCFGGVEWGVYHFNIIMYRKWQ
jgi:hypothetical protein